VVVHLPTLPKPRLRGRLHQVAFFVSIPAGLMLVALARAATARVGAIVFAVTLTGLYGVSAAYHRGSWSVRARRVMKHLDHSMIFVFIAGTYTPVTLLALRPAWAITLLVLAWSGAAVGVVITVLRLERWHGVGFALYLVLGWLAIVAAPQLFDALSRVELALLVVGGVLYTVGAIVLARKRPDPSPVVFGYHEVWHTFVVGANACHFALVLLLVRA
jgi:hemolysin III